ncbi:MAG: SusE domain-containing protein [Lutibacter sp.]|uniref:SusE domain-containing protein n=1 Tax=Lutibacter sp. TaxID=1925666 RepID=UPI00299E64C7|nr:SusE domain-containing protein [Lutibacter sp.]MDX1830380.1 SusE domain-containing protein [Lutibacter sp.]
MKKIFKNILMLFTATTLLVACDSQDLTVLDPNASTTVSLSASDVVLDPNNAGQDVLTVNWTEPDFGFNAGVNYQVILTYTGSDPKVINIGNNLSKVFENVELNKILLGLGLPAGESSEVTVQVKAVLSATSEILSNTTTFNATVYADKLDLSTIWGVVGSATPNGWDGPDMPFYTTSDANVLVAYVSLADGFIKFRTNNSWDLNYGDDGNDGTLEAGGADIPVNAGTYKITFNITDLTYTIETYTWGLVGDATPNSWDGPDMPMSYDSYSDTWKAVVTLADGDIKFRFNNDWALNYGDDGADGTLENGGANITVTAGNYLVTLDLNNLVYTIEPIDIWGLVGDAAPNGWDGPNVRFTPDYGTDGVWYLNGVTLIDGTIKFRTNDSWDVNYGDDGNDGTLESGGANIPVTAGTYDIVLDFSDPNAPTYTITAS